MLPRVVGVCVETAELVNSEAIDMCITGTK